MQSTKIKGNITNFALRIYRPAYAKNLLIAETRFRVIFSSIDTYTGDL
jgi:hypothetical protein